MTNDFTTAPSTSIIFDGWRSISISLYMALVGYSVMVSVPVLSTAMVGMLGFTEEQVGRVWGADLGGLSLGAILASLLVARFYVIDAQHLLLDRLGPANSVTTGLDGRYAFPGLPDGVIDLGVRVLAGGYLPALRKDVTVPEVGRSTVDFVLEHGRAVKAHLEGEWSGATVWAADSRLKGRLLPPGPVAGCAVADSIILLNSSSTLALKSASIW